MGLCGGYVTNCRCHPRQGHEATQRVARDRDRGSIRLVSPDIAYFVQNYFLSLL